MRHLNAIFILVIACSWINARQVVVTVSIADALMHPVGGDEECIRQAYDALSYMSDRACQFLFNSVLEVVHDTGHEICVMPYNMFYGVDEFESSKKLREFWVPKRCVMYLDELSEEIKNSLPRPISYEDDYWGDAQHIVLSMPWYSTLLSRQYSVGTRFVRKPAWDTRDSYAVLILDPTNRRTVVEYVDRHGALIEGSIPVHLRRAAFVALIERWLAAAHRYQTEIPYVWGGASFLLSGSVDDGKWGFDCSSLILRAAQIVGIPLATKVSAMMEQFLEQAQSAQDIEPGDIIWYPGHVMIVGDLSRNDFLHACGYETCYGRLCRLPLSAYLQGVQTYYDLFEKYVQNEPVAILSRMGTVARVQSRIKVLKLPTFFSGCRRSTATRLINDVTVAASVNTVNPRPGDIITYTILATNNTLLTLLPTVTDLLPAGVTYISSTLSQGSYTPSSGQWTITALLIGQTATLTITARVNTDTGGKFISNCASSTLNTSCASILVQNTADIQVKRAMTP